jgi:type I site-specific restriction endonuclease
MGQAGLVPVRSARELRKQAKNAFNDFLPADPHHLVPGPFKREERIFLATYPAMQKVFQSFDHGFFDLIIADEPHRSITYMATSSTISTVTRSV